MLSSNPLFELEIAQIYNNPVPDHDCYVSAIIHTPDKDLNVQRTVTLDYTSDYIGKTTDSIMLTMEIGLGDYGRLIYPHRDDLQVTIEYFYNGLKLRKLYKGILINNINNSYGPSGKDSLYSDTFKNNTNRIELIIQCINPVWAVMKQITTNGVINNRNLEDAIRCIFYKYMSVVEINSKKVKPIIDITPPSNERVYSSIVFNDRLRLLDIPTELQYKYGLYNGGIGTYIYSDRDDKHIMSVYPVYNESLLNKNKITLAIYISDSAIFQDINNKTTMLDGTVLKIISTSNVESTDIGDFSNYDYGSGYKVINSNNIMDRKFTKDGNIVNVNAEEVIDSHIDANNKAGLAFPVFLPNTDNLYNLRSIIMQKNSKEITIDWNFSRPDYLYPAMHAEIISVRNGKIVRENGVLVGAYSNYDNKYRNIKTKLRIIINKQ